MLFFISLWVPGCSLMAPKPCKNAGVFFLQAEKHCKNAGKMHFLRTQGLETKTPISNHLGLP